VQSLSLHEGSTPSAITKTMKKLLIISPIFVLGLMAFAGHAQAATLFSWTATDDFYTLANNGDMYTGGYGGGCNTTCQIQTSGTLDNITFKFYSQATRGNTTYMNLLNDLGTDIDCTSGTIDTTGLASGDTFTFPGWYGTACDVNSGTLYGMRLHTNGSSMVLYAGDDGAINPKAYQVWAEAVAPVDIEFSAPTDNATTADFYFWTLNLTSIESGQEVSVLYFGQDLDTPVYSDQIIWNNQMETTGFLLPKSVLLYEPPNQINTDWIAQAYIKNSDGDTIASSGYINFTVDAARQISVTGDQTSEFASSSIWGQLSSSTLNCSQYAFVDTYIGGTIPFFASTTATRMACEVGAITGNIVKALVIPPTTGIGSTANLGAQLGDFKNVVPFNIYFSTIGSIQEGIATSTSGTDTISIDLPTLTQGETTSFDVFTSTTLTGPLTTTGCNSACAEGIVDNWQNWIKTAIWAGAGLSAIMIIML